MMAPAPFRAAPGEPVPAPKEIKDAPAQPKKETNLGNKAQVIVQSPTDSRLIVDGRPIAVGSAPLLTPELEPNRDYYYVVQAQAMRDGVMVQEAQRVIVRAGHSSRVEFDLSNTAVARRQAAQPARITVQLPPDAKLFVDGKPRELAGSTQTFETPKLEPGKTFYYVFRSDLMRDGETKSEDRRVVVEAGKQVTVDFRGAMETTAAKR